MIVFEQKFHSLALRISRDHGRTRRPSPLAPRFICLLCYRVDFSAFAPLSRCRRFCFVQRSRVAVRDHQNHIHHVVALCSTLEFCCWPPYDNNSLGLPPNHHADRYLGVLLVSLLSPLNVPDVINLSRCGFFRRKQSKISCPKVLYGFGRGSRINIH